MDDSNEDLHLLHVRINEAESEATHIKHDASSDRLSGKSNNVAPVVPELIDLDKEDDQKLLRSSFLSQDTPTFTDLDEANPIVDGSYLSTKHDTTGTVTKTFRNGEKRHNIIVENPVKKRNNQSQLSFATASGKGPITLKLNLGPSPSPAKTKKSNTQLSFITGVKTSLSNIIESSIKPKKASLGTIGENSREIDSSSKFIVKIPFKQSSSHDSTDAGPAFSNASESILLLSQSKDSANLPAKSKRITFKLKPSISRTTIIQDKSKPLRSNPGPLVPLNYDLYDDNLINASCNEVTTDESLAFGYPIVHKPWILDIIYIISFLNTFKDILKVGPLGPADFEEGLGFNSGSDSGQSDTSSDNEKLSVSLAMDALFRKLLELVLNRKKPIVRDGQRSALQELKSKYVGFGLPQEWRDDTKVYDTVTTKWTNAENIVPRTNQDSLVEETIEFGESMELMNPFHEPSFETLGLSGIKSADDRCIMLRSMVTWCLSENTIIKQFITDATNKVDISGERSTLYGSRAILKGISQTIEMKKAIDGNTYKPSKSALLDIALKSSDPKYFDSASNPLEHPLAFRFMEFIVGDCGFHIGRFYLVRMADVQSGRVSGIEQMRAAMNNVSPVRLSLPSSFSLFVEDVHSLLTESLAEFGVEFDKEGKEVKRETHCDESQHWYCVASTCEELESFLDYLGAKLGVSGHSENTLPEGSIAYKPALHMFQYLRLLLPLLVEYEGLRASSVGMDRASRRKRVAYRAEDLDNDDYIDAGADEDYSEEEEHDDEYVE